MRRYLPRSGTFVAQYASRDHYRAYVHLAAIQGRVWRVGGYLVMFVVDIPWWTNRPMLYEQFVLRIAPGGELKDVTDFFERIAKASGCFAVQFGTSITGRDAGYCAALEQLGYVQSTDHTLVKEIKNV